MSFRLSGLAHASKGAVKNGLRAALRAASAANTSSLAPEHFGLTVRGDELSWCGHALSSLTPRFGSPLHVVSEDRLRRNASRFVSAAARVESGCEVLYSFKTNPVPGVLSVLAEQGVGAEVISHYELWLARRLGFPSERIVYNGPVKSDASLREAIEADIMLLNINHREELARVVRVARELGRRPRVGVRVTVGGGWSGQFGTPVLGGLALQVFREALESDALDVVGLHAHRGGMLRTRAEVLEFVEQVLAFADSLRGELGLELSLLNLGGSLASPSVRGLSSRELKLNQALFKELEAPAPEQTLAIEDYVELLGQRVTAHYQSAGRRPPRLLLEPGRSVTSDAQLLLCQVQSLKADGERTYAILDAGINLAESCRSEYHQLFVANRAAAPRSQFYALAGPICTPGDTLYWATKLPALEAGDCVAIMDAGAYFVPFATSFSYPRPAIVLLPAEGGSPRVLRRRETFEDLLSLDATAPEGS